MEIGLQLRHLLGLDRKGANLLQLAGDIGISRYQLMHLLDPDARQINREALGRVCDYLLGHGTVSMGDLPACLFVTRTSEFWSLLTERQRISIWIGERWFKQVGADGQVNSADSMMQSVLINQLTGVRAERAGSSNTPASGHQVIDSKLIPCWANAGPGDAEIIKCVRKEFRSYQQEQSDKALVCIGSIKSNPMCEPVVAAGFKHCKPFLSADGAERPQTRPVPFYMRYRRSDPHPASCWGGCQLATDKTCGRRSADKSGVYYAVRGDQWDFAPCDQEHDAAVVYYRYAYANEKLEMVLAGYTGRSTRSLAELLAAEGGQRLWPPQIDNQRTLMGAFVVRFRYPPNSTAGPGRQLQQACQVQVVGIEPRELASRVLRPRPSTRSRKRKRKDD